MNILKLLTLVSMFKDVTAQVQAAGEEKRPWYMQRTVWGAIMALLSAAVAALFGLTIDPEHINKLVDNIPSLITTVTAVWGTLLSVFGLVMKAVKAKKEASATGKG